ncbi:hypothetical protein CY34DRAFT_476368 [Suillus luteus UH-Slu-Lm8-n1]|uniref:WD40 repeat-like protein n=1 Tax=Suillus luteus UH-Slu-Lm8-n1 TaxID=930992 RepID=A0A0D0AG66_9AGAM|nr:hypothetical protein CY34DRAFT_476368 [Suillus luteus UH-Slu-Lm8-n1]
MLYLRCTLRLQSTRSKLLCFSPRTNALWPGRSDPPRDPSDSSATSPLPLNRFAMTAIVQAVISGHADAIRSVSFSPDGTRIASGSRDKTVRLWEATGQLLSEPLEGHTEVVWSVSFSPDGTRIASGSRDQTMRHWDAATGRLTLQAGHRSQTC